MRSLAARCLPLLIALCAPPALAQTIPCGEPYIVRPGDTLQRIARRAYGPDATFRDLLGPNRDAFRNGDPSLIAVGQTIAIPCREAVAPAVEAEASRRLRLVPTAAVMSPVARRVLEAAAGRAGIPALDMGNSSGPVGDLPAALAALPGPVIAAAVPRPDCAATDRAAPVAAVCDGLLWSAPLAEAVISTFTRADQGPITLPGALDGRALCTVPSVPGYLLAVRGASGSVTKSTNATACLTQLRAGAVDAAVIPAVEADAAMADLPPGAEIIEQFAMAQLATLHAVALPDRAEAAEALARLDKVLAELRRDGTWMALVTGEATRN